MPNKNVARTTAREAIVAAEAIMYAPRRKPRPKRDPDPAHRLADHWLRCWQQYPVLTDLRLSGGKGQVIGYMRSMLKQRSEKRIELLITAFVRDLAEGEIQLRPGQTAFLAFTGWSRKR